MITDTFEYSFLLDDFSCNTYLGGIFIDDYQRKNLAGLASLQKVNGDLHILNSDSLLNLSGLENLTSVDGILNIINNARLNSIDSLHNLTDLDSLALLNNDSLFSCCVVSQIFINSKLDEEKALISGNGQECLSYLEVNELCYKKIFPCGVINRTDTFKMQQEIDSLDCMTFYGNIFITGEDIFNLQEPLSNLRRIKGDLTLNETGFEELIGLKSIDTINGDISITNNERLKIIDHTFDMEIFTGDLIVESNDSLTRIKRQNTFNSNNSISLINNPQLQSFELFNVDAQIRQLKIKNNSKLRDIDNLRNLLLIEDSLVIIENDSLNSCCILKSLINYQIVDSSLTLISNNNDSCSNLENIIMECPLDTTYVGLKETAFNSLITLKINDLVQLQTTIPESENALTLRLYDITGKLLKQSDWEIAKSGISVPYRGILLLEFLNQKTGWRTTQKIHLN